jgi:hypothetical protein
LRRGFRLFLQTDVRLSGRDQDGGGFVKRHLPELPDQIDAIHARHIDGGDNEIHFLPGQDVRAATPSSASRTLCLAAFSVNAINFRIVAASSTAVIVLLIIRPA